jgi:aminoglycoside phosphotransferase
VRPILVRVAEQLHRTLGGFTESISELTDDGYIRGYRLDLLRADGGRENRLVFVEYGSRYAPAPGVLTVPLEGAETATVWLYPSDPGLAALRDVTDVVSVARVLSRMGVNATPIAVEVVSYRPGRRAVVRVDSAPRPLFLKIVEPGKAESISERHELFRSSGLPVPRLFGWSSDGLIAMSGLPGIDAQLAVGRISNQTAFLNQVEFLCSLIAAVPAVNTARESLFRRLDWYLNRLCARLPEESERIARLGAVIAATGADGAAFAFTPVTIHGDFHLGQLFVDSDSPDAIAGVLDIDTAGVGDPADDAAAFYAHLLALGEATVPVDPASADVCFRLAAAWLARWPRNLNAGFALRARAIGATHLLGHALQPQARDSYAVSRRLLERAESLVGAA